MKILRLELFGFKSFQQKTVINFDQPITAIVGSNGCGKSNVVDALYWVMGDMSPKHLRGNTMVDVIFSGSRDHAALDMAEVTLVLERDEEKDPPLPPQFQNMREMQITRRYYRSGDSEYFINKTQCRLRDIQEFFMDTGVGAKAYSIIEQGAITRMVQQKPEDRRMVIEEVAGIMKFKARRAETERKLEHTHTNMQRIDDILKDLQKSLGSLKRQADRAEKYSSYTKELKELELRLAGQQWIDHRDSTAQSSALKGEIALRLEASEHSLNEKRTHLAELRQRLSEIEQELVEKRSFHREAELALKDNEAELNNLEFKKDNLAQRIAENYQQEENLTERDQVLDKQIREINVELDSMVLQSTEAKGNWDDCRAKAVEHRKQTEELRSTVDNSRREFHQTQVEQTKLTEKIQNLQHNHRELLERQERLDIQISEVESETKIHSAEKNTTTQFLEEAFSKRSDLESQKHQLDQSLSEEETHRDSLQASRNQLRDEHTHTKIRREHLESLDRKLEGVGAATRSIALKLRELGDPNPLLASRIQAPELLERAIEAVLGDNLQRAYTETLDQVESLKSHLSHSSDEEARRGRTQILLDRVFKQQDFAETPLDAVPFFSPGASQEIPGPDNVIGFSLEKRHTSFLEFLIADTDVLGPLNILVEEKEELNTEWTKLLKNVWVVKDASSFEKILKACNYKLPVDLVSLRGDRLTREGYLDLAAIDESQDQSAHSLVHRRNEIARLATAQEQMEANLGDLEAKLKVSDENVETIRSKIRELTAQLVDLNPDLEKHSQFLRQVEAQLARLQEKARLLKADLETSRARSQEVSSQLEEATYKLSECETLSNIKEETLSKAEADLREATNALRVFEEESQIHEKRFQELNSIVQEKRNQLASCKQERQISQTRHEQLKLERGRLIEDQESVEQSLVLKLEAHQERKAVLEQAAEVLHSQEEQVQDQKMGVDSLVKEVESLANDTQHYHSTIKDLEQKNAVVEEKVRNLEERIEEKYQIKLSELDESTLKEILSPSDLEEMLNADAAKARVDKLRDQIERLGKINMVAKEEFDEKRQRYEYLYIQKKDVEDAISQLREAIDKIDRESRERFATAFNDVNGAFQKTFPILFGGGSAELKLTNPDNLLESGVEIVAQPPGKKLQSVTLLSGGEKALTAVSLIFGIFSIKPSPFCVLDEVDAPLDDTNVGRFNTQVRNMSKTSQIIMITHHKKTMESSDALFGVTMQQPGVSKIASARIGIK